MDAPPSDARLIRESRRRPDAFVEVCERHAADLTAWLRGQTRNADVADELLAETLAQAWRSRRRYRDPGTGSAKPWLFGIARNLHLRYRREGAVETRARRRLGMATGTSDGDPFADVDNRLAAATEGRVLADGIAMLPPEQREALALRIVGERDYDEIAAELAIRPATARTRVFRALSALRTHLEGGRR